MFNFGIIGFQDVFVAMHSGKYVTAIINQSFTQTFSPITYTCDTFD